MIQPKILFSGSRLWTSFSTKTKCCSNILYAFPPTGFTANPWRQRLAKRYRATGDTLGRLDIDPATARFYCRVFSGNLLCYVAGV